MQQRQGGYQLLSSNRGPAAAAHAAVTGHPRRRCSGRSSRVTIAAVPANISSSDGRQQQQQQQQHAHHDQHIWFQIPPASLSTPTSDVLACPTMHELLGPPRPNPLLENLAGVWEGKYVSNDDRVALNVMSFGSPTSTGANKSTLGQVAAGAAAAAAAAAAGTSSCHLAMSSGVYGSMDSSSASLDAATQQQGQGQGGQQQHPFGHQEDVCMPLPAFAMRAGPREEIYFDPSTVTAAIVTTGGICPGMNDVIEAMVKRLGDYGVAEESVMGIRYGMRGFLARDAKPVVLTRDKIDGIHLQGGTILGTSIEHRLRRRRHRHHHQHSHASSSESEPPSPSGSTTDEESGGGGSSSNGASSYNARSDSPIFATYEDRLEAVLDKLEFWRISMLLVIGGQGGNQLAAQLAEGCTRRAIPCCIVGVPKSIDNDCILIDRTFGFDTVVQEVVARPLLAAKTEAASARKGVGLVKVFGRRAGFIALQASLASGVVDICLIPEERFELEGPNGVLAYLKTLLEDRGHAVICVSEGAGQDILYAGKESIPVDEAGNPVLKDIGAHLKAAIKAAIPDSDVKYIDPSNMIQAVPCNAADHIFCRTLGFHAVDVAFAGFTGVMVGPVNGHYSMLPSAVITQTSRRVDVFGKTWNRLRASIAQPHFANPPGSVKEAAAAPAAASKK